MILWNAGVKLAAANSAAIDHIKRLVARGVTVICCRTCVEYFGLEEEIAVGEIDGMVRIQEVLLTRQVLTV
mgnify:FL=1